MRTPTFRVSAGWCCVSATRLVSNDVIIGSDDFTWRAVDVEREEVDDDALVLVGVELPHTSLEGSQLGLVEEAVRVEVLGEFRYSL